jgi:hypothetical protein
MPVRFVCLANSFKEGGRCLAGIEVDNNNNPRIENGHPKWIRPICNTPHGEVPTHLVAHLNILDIIEIDITGYPKARDYQTENALFHENSIRVHGRYNSNNLNELCDNRNLIFGNRGKAVSEEAIGTLSYSLMLINTNQFEVIEKTYEDNPIMPKMRMVFFYNGNQYDLPVTDPVFQHKYRINPDIMEEVADVYLSLSLAVLHNHWHSKLVAGIIFQ